MTMPPPRPDQIINPPAAVVYPSSTNVLRAQLVIVYDSGGAGITGVFVYSGAPGLGNGPIAWMSPNSKDPYGNTITPGLGATEGLVDGTVIAAATITATQIADATITAEQIANATITSQQIADGTITGTNIASATIDGTNIASGTIDGSNIASATIEGSNIASGTITGSNVASGTIDGVNIGTGTITASNIEDATITTAQISGSAGITGSQIATGTVTASNIADQTITATQIASETITASQIENLTITAGQIADATITGAQIADATIAGANIADATITNTQIASDTITGSNIESGTITGANIADATITGGLIENTTITGSNLVDNTITATQIASETITASQIASGTITGTNIASETITASNIASGTITATQIDAGTVVAGIVDGTTITGAEFVAEGSSGEILVYSSTPAAGNLVASVSAESGTDSKGNTYLPGVYSYDQIDSSFFLASGINNGEVGFYYTTSYDGTWTGLGTLSGNLNDDAIFVNTTVPFALGNQASNPPSAIADTSATLYGSGGALAYIHGTDGNAYKAGHLIVYGTPSQNIDSTTPATITGATCPVGPIAYKLRCQLWIGQGDNTSGSSLINFNWTAAGPSLSLTGRFFTGTQVYTYSTSYSDSNNQYFTGPVMGVSGGTYWWEFEGFIIFPSSGTFSIQGAEGVSGESWLAQTFLLEMTPI